MTWVYDVPTWAAAALLIGGMCALASLGLWLYVFRFRRDSSLDHNDVAGPIIGAAGTVLAVLLSLMVVGVWEEYDAANRQVAQEAASLADLVRLSHLIPEPRGASIRQAVRQYTNAVVNDEWPLMAAGSSSAHARALSEDLLLRVADGVPSTPAQQERFAMNLQLVTSAIDGRRARLQANSETIPGVLWLVMMFTGGLTIFLSFLFRVKTFRVHVTMVLVLTAIIGAIFLLIAELDLPFRGEFAIDSSAFQSVYNALTF